MIRLSTEWLSVCAGCHVAVVDLHEKLLQVLQSVAIVRSPVLMDAKTYPEADVGIVTGAIRTEHDLKAAQEMRKSCKTLISFGTCAVFGGISGAGMLHTPQEIFDTVYNHNPTTRAGKVPSNDVPPLVSYPTPLDDAIDVDLYLPGCPPHPYFIFEALRTLIEGRPIQAEGRTVCARCDRKMRRNQATELRRDFAGSPEDDTCLLSQGYLCFGSVTSDRCLAPCPKNGITCSGCAGPSRQILTEPNRDIRTELADRMHRLTGIAYKDILSHLERYSKTYYAFAMSSPMISRKPTFLIRQWTQQPGG